MRKVLFGMALCVCAAGCVATGFGASGRSGREVGIGSKVVMAKVEPNTLVAADRSSCMVSTERWKEAVVGKPFTCDWRHGG